MKTRAVALFRRIAGAFILQNTTRHSPGFTEDSDRGEHTHHNKQREEDYSDDKNRHKAPRPLFSADNSLASVMPITIWSELGDQLSFLSSPSICSNSLFSSNV